MTEHELTQKMIEHEARLAGHDEELKTLFRQQKEMRELVESVHELALSVQELTGKVKDVDGRLEVIETDRRQKGHAIWQIVVSALLGGAITYLVTCMF